MKLIKYISYTAATLFMLAIIIFIPTIANNVSPTYILLMGAFLSIDMATMLKKTSGLPEGQFALISPFRYIYTLLLSLSMLIVTYFIGKKYGLNLDTTLSSLAITVISILAIFIGGTEANKLLTNSSGFFANGSVEGVGGATKKEEPLEDQPISLNEVK